MNTLTSSRPGAFLRVPAVCALIVVLVLAMRSPQVHAQVTTDILIGSNLTIGSRGADVATLQGILSELGYLNVPYGVPFGYFGSLTRAAVARYQAAAGVSPSVGYFGPITKSAMRTQFMSHGWLSLLGWQ